MKQFEDTKQQQQSNPCTDCKTTQTEHKEITKLRKMITKIKRREIRWGKNNHEKDENILWEPLKRHKCKIFCDQCLEIKTLFRIFLFFVLFCVTLSVFLRFYSIILLLISWEIQSRTKKTRHRRFWLIFKSQTNFDSSDEKSPLSKPKHKLHKHLNHLWQLRQHLHLTWCLQLHWYDLIN